MLSEPLVPALALPTVPGGGLTHTASPGGCGADCRGIRVQSGV